MVDWSHPQIIAALVAALAALFVCLLQTRINSKDAREMRKLQRNMAEMQTRETAMVDVLRNEMQKEMEVFKNNLQEKLTILQTTLDREREQSVERLKLYLTHEEADYREYWSAIREVLACIQSLRKANEHLLFTENPTERREIWQGIKNYMDNFECVFKERQLDLRNDRELVHRIKAQCVCLVDSATKYIDQSKINGSQSIDEQLNTLKQLQKLLTDHAENSRRVFETNIKGRPTS